MMKMLSRLKDSKTLKLFVGTILGAIAGMFLPEAHSLHLSYMQGVQVIIGSLGMIFMRDGVAKSGPS